MLSRAPLRLALLAVGLLTVPSVLFAQADTPPDAAGISLSLLYHPAERIEVSSSRITFRAQQFTYTFNPATSQWAIAREKHDVEPRGVTRYLHAASGTEFRFRGSSTDDAGILEIYRGAEEDPLAKLELWNRGRLAAVWLGPLQRDNPRMSLDQLRQELEPSEPEVGAVADDGADLWLAIRYYAGEGVHGIGTLVRLDPGFGETRAFQPAELATASISTMVATPGSLWLGTHDEGEGAILPAVGLARFNPASGEVKSYLGKIAGQMVTALLAQPDALWIGTDAGICRIALPDESTQCWRIVPRVTLAAETAVSDHPGSKPRGKLPAGAYEVRWANAGFLEVVTPDAMEGWIETDDLAEYVKHDFDQRPYELANTYGGGAGVMRLLDEPDSDPMEAAQVYRAALETIGAPNAQGWQRVRARVGWIARGKLEVAPVLERAGP